MRIATRICLTVALASSLLLSAPSWASEGLSGRSHDDTPNAVLFNAGDLISGIVTVEYERALSPWFGLNFGISVASFTGAFQPNPSATLLWAGPEVGARFHFIEGAPGGLWVGPYLHSEYIFRPGGPTGRDVGYGFGAGAGYNFFLTSHLLLQLGAAGGLSDRGTGLNWDARLRIGIGAAF